MSVTPSSTIVGVFRDQAVADQAVNALYNAGFRQEDIQYMVPGTSGSFFEGLKNFLTGTNEGGDNLVDNLTGMGLSDTDASYYATEYNNGNPILIVRAAGRETEAMRVLHQYGAFSTQTEPAYSGEAAGDTRDTQQPNAYSQQDSSMADMQPSGDYTEQSGYGAPGQHDNVQDLEAQPRAQPVEEHPYGTAQPENATPDYDLSDQDTRIIPPQNDTNAQDMDIQARDMQVETDTPAPAFDTDNSAFETDTAMREQDSETPTLPTPRLPSDTPEEYEVYRDAQASETDVYEQSVEATPDMDETTSVYSETSIVVPETGTGDQTAQPDTTTPEQDYRVPTDQATSSAMNGYDSPQQAWQVTPETSSQATDMQPAYANAASPASPEQTDELQQLQAQLQTLQQQLQEAKARLAEAKEQENQARTAREREQQLQSARQQLQDLQAELQATLAEYQEIQSRITQYQ